MFAGAAWQRCRTHFMANLLIRVPKRSQPGVATMVRTIHKQLSPEKVHSQADQVAAQLREHLPQASQMLEDALSDILGLHRFPGVPLAEALVQQSPGAPEQREPPAYRRGGHLPQPGRSPSSGGAVLAEQHDE